MVQMSLKGRPI